MDIFSLLEEIQITARNGLNYSENPYDLERYEHLLALAANTYSSLFTLKVFQDDGALTVLTTKWIPLSYMTLATITTSRTP